MAKATSSEELLLKKRARRRLVGAIALVLIVVVFLPMILDNEPRKMSEDIAINIPTVSQDVPSDPPSREPLGFTPIETLSKADQQEAVSSKPVIQNGQKAEVEPKPSPRSEPEEAVAAAKSVAEPEGAAANDGFIVQLGAFSNAANARNLAAKVRENRFKAYTEVVTTTNGKRTRVRVGPYPTRAAAEDARDTLESRKLTFGKPAILRSSE